MISSFISLPDPEWVVVVLLAFAFVTAVTRAHSRITELERRFDSPSRDTYDIGAHARLDKLVARVAALERRGKGLGA